MDTWNVVISVLAGLATAIPLVLKLVEYVQKAVKEKNWAALMRVVMELMAEAEQKFASGAERKEWVLDMAEASAEIINYDIDLTTISTMIDELCDMSKQVNAA